MSTAALTKLLDLLTSTLTTSDMIWLVKEMEDYLHNPEEKLKPYTVEELLQRAEKGRREIAQGKYVTSEDLFHSLFEEFGLDPDEMKETERQIELQYAEAV